MEQGCPWILIRNCGIEVALVLETLLTQHISPRVSRFGQQSSACRFAAIRLRLTKFISIKPGNYLESPQVIGGAIVNAATIGTEYIYVAFICECH